MVSVQSDGGNVYIVLDGDTLLNQKLAIVILARAKAYAPSRGGTLRNSGTIVKLENGFKIVFNCNYAIYVHENTTAKHFNGTSKFLIKAYEEVMASV